MARDAAALPDPELPPGDPAGSKSGAARSGWLRWVGVAGLCAVIWGGLVLAWPYWEKHQAYAIVAEHFAWDEKEKVATVKIEASEPGPGTLGELDRKTVRALRILGARRLVVFDCSGITSVAELRDTATLQSVHLSYCKRLTSVVGLPAGVQRLYLRGCTGLTGVAGLPAGLQELDLGRCTGLTGVAGLPAGLQELDLSSCKGLTSASGLPAALQVLDLSNCEGLTSLTGLPAGMTWLRLWECKGLTLAEPLPRALTYLDLRGCAALRHVGTLPAGLMKVEMANTPKLPEEVKAQIRALVKKNGGEVLGE